MAYLPRPEKIEHIKLPPRDALIAGDTDVLVVGGGPAGIGAAMGAARAGAKVVLAERYGFLGGNATAALVIPLMSFYTQVPTSEVLGIANLYPTDHGMGEPVVAGVLLELLNRLVSRGGAIAPSEKTGYVVTFDPEILKMIALEMLDEAGINLLLHSFASDVVGGNNVTGAVFETKSGPVVVRAKAVIDCTGDGDMAARAGAPFEIGRMEDGRVQPMSLMFRMVEFERHGFNKYVEEHPKEWSGVHGLFDLIKKATAKGELELLRENILMFATPHEKEIAINSTRVTGVMGIDVWDLTKAEIMGRLQMRQIASFLKHYVPGFEKSYVAQSGAQIGVRETRRIMGAYKLTTHDVLEARKFEDVIARCAYPIDIHNPSGRGTILKRLAPGQSYDIPLRCLLPEHVDGLVLAGRCISGTHQAHSSYRCMPTAMATGQAAGICAAFSVRHRMKIRNVPTEDVQSELLRQGANLGKHQIVY